MTPYRQRLPAILLILAMLISACSLPGSADAPTQISVDAIYTAAAQTLEAQLTQSAASQPTTPPTETPVPAEPTSAEPPTPEFTPTPSVPPATPTPSVPMAVVNVNSNCRSGPSTLYTPALAVLRQGDRTEIHGRNSDRSWWVVQIPGKNADCWIWGNNVNVEGDTSNVPIINPPPVPVTPTFTPTPVVKFDPSFDNIHECNGDPYAIFELDNIGKTTFESMRIKIEDTDADKKIYDHSSDAPFMSGSDQCPEGSDSFKAGKTAWVAGNIDKGVDGNSGLATITLCTGEDLDGICVTHEVDFTIDLTP